MQNDRGVVRTTSFQRRSIQPSSSIELTNPSIAPSKKTAREPKFNKTS